MPPVETVERYGRGARWLHAVVYVVVLIQLVTGWWWILAHYQRSFVQELTGIADGDLHVLPGMYLVIPVVLISCLMGRRAVRMFTAESMHFLREDVGWFRRWPRSVLSGRFAYHDGHFDPGQRLANIVMVVTITTLYLTGLGMMYLPGSLVDTLYVVHRWAAFLITPVLLGHILIGAGVLPGYRGVWRSMHLGGHLRADVAKRIWPEWLNHQRVRR